MKLFETLGDKSWIAQQSVTVENSVLEAQFNPDAAARIVLRFIMAIVSVLFFLFIITFLARSQYPDFEALAGAPWQPFTDASALWLNTAILASSSLAMQLGLRAVRTQRFNAAVISISAAVFFSVGFLLAQLDLWGHLQATGFYVSSNPANSYFYLLTAVHGLHIIGGLIVLANVVLKLRDNKSIESISAPLQICTTYWHFLLGIWLVLFALLTSEPSTINALAAMCGF